MNRSTLPPTCDPGYDYLLCSDVHIGADLTQHVRPAPGASACPDPDRELREMLRHYRDRPPGPGRRWCLVFAGDLVDFVGMNLPPRSTPEAPLHTPLTAEERAHGLGTARDHAVAKMEAVAERHRALFEELGAFVAAGHRLVLVRGNHDLDFHWDAARQAFVDAVLRGAPTDDLEQLEAIERRIEFHPWFYYVEGLLYVEHGHQFDALCNQPWPLAPHHPLDPRRLLWTVSDWLLRGVARPTPTLPTGGHHGFGTLDYLRLGLRLGLGGALDLGLRFARALLRAWRSGRAALGAGARALREEHERRMAELARRSRVRLEALRELASLWPRPVAASLGPMLRLALLDRLGVGLLAATALLVLLVLSVPLEVGLPSAAALLATFWLYVRHSARRRRREMDPSRRMLEAARRIAKLLPAPFVVMGHTHRPLLRPLGRHRHFVNLGCWGSDSPGVHPVSHTLLVLRQAGRRLEAELVQWHARRGPERLALAPVPVARYGRPGPAPPAA